MPITKTCDHCGTQFAVKPTKSHQRFCSKDCVIQHEKVHGRPAATVAAVTFTCEECQAPFTYKPAYLTAYRKKFNKNPPYCSRNCAYAGMRRKADEKHKTSCKNCGKEFQRSRRKGSGTIYREQVLCSRQCKNEWTSKVHRAKHGLPQITKRSKRGYVVLRVPARNGVPLHEILEHRQIMEDHIGRKLLPLENVHHINGQKADNRIENLELWSTMQPHGQRVIDKAAFAIEMLQLYPEFARSKGFELKAICESKDHFVP